MAWECGKCGKTVSFVYVQCPSCGAEKPKIAIKKSTYISKPNPVNKIEAERKKPIEDDTVKREPENKLTKCNACNTEVSINAYSCPKCGEPFRRDSLINDMLNKHKLNIVQLLGLVGSFILFISLFTPAFTVPIVGSILFYKSDYTYILIVLNILSIIFNLAKKYLIMVISGLLIIFSLLLFLYGIIETQNELKLRMEKELAGNPFRGIVETVAQQSMQFQWGWAMMFAGASFITVPYFFTNREKDYCLIKKLSNKKLKYIAASTAGAIIISIGTIIVYGIYTVNQEKALIERTERLTKKYEKIYHAVNKIKAATEVGVNYNKFTNMVQDLNAEHSILLNSGNIKDEKEIKIMKVYAEILEVYVDSLKIWRYTIENITKEDYRKNTINDACDIVKKYDSDERACRKELIDIEFLRYSIPDHLVKTIWEKSNVSKKIEKIQNIIAEGLSQRKPTNERK
ncbi:MAG: hypothetical protein H7843_09150 [Nitrospirota bacterium]